MSENKEYLNKPGLETYTNQLVAKLKTILALKGETATDAQVAAAVTDWLDENVSPAGSAVTVDASLSVAGSSADAKAAGDAVTHLSDDLRNYNAFDVWDGLLTRTGGTSHKVVYTWSGGVCTVTTPNGASDDYSANVILAVSDLPASVVPGETYYVRYTTTLGGATGVRLRIIFRDSGGTAVSTSYFSESGSVIIPSGAAKWHVSLFVGSGVTFTNPVTVSDIHFLSAKTNRELETDTASLSDGLSGAVVMRGTLAGGTDLDGVKTPGIWVLSSGYSYPHTPIPAGYAGLLCVFPASANSIGQAAYVMTSNMTMFHCYMRSAVGGSYLAWKQMDGMPSYGVLADNTDLDTLKQSGNWVLNSGNHYPHSPISSAVGGLLSVFPGSANSVVQIVTVLSKTNLDYVHLYVRCAVGGRFDAEDVYIGWKQIDGSGATYSSEYTLNHYDNTYNITCSPTITADANNYLASTGDDTDRTGDIQSILDSTGTCHLGPGNFYVTGIEIPDDASLIGSGNGTVLYLAASITDGYAVKLKSRSSVSHMQIKGSTEEPALSAEVGARHGIIFESNIVSRQDGGTGEGTIYRQSAITGCGIANFTGGGITLTGTGVDIASNTLISDCFIDHCGAGIYIPYYSEFHRISNCAVTRCWYGTVDNGGNNNFSNCDFSGCRVGIQISPSTNNSHGSFTNCSVNHSKSSAGESNKGTAILLQGAARGEIFTGMQIFFGKIEIRDSVGIRFIGANVGRQVPIVIEDSSVVTFTDCTFAEGPASTDSPFTQSGNGYTEDGVFHSTLKFTGCCLRSGKVYDPMA